MFAINLNENGRILSATFEQYKAPEMVLTETLPDGDISDYIFKDGAFVYDPLEKPEEPEQAETINDRVADLENAMQILLEGRTENDGT